MASVALRSIGLSKKIKLAALDDTVSPESPAVDKLETMFLYDIMLSNGITIIERLAHLDQLKKQRFIFFCFPTAMGGLDAFPVRAVSIDI
jgi:kynurenine formamidase